MPSDHQTFSRSEIVEMHGDHQTFFGSKKSGNPKEKFYIIILGVEMPSNHGAFFRRDIGCRDASQPPCVYMQLCWVQSHLTTARYLCALILGKEVHGGCHAFLLRCVRCNNAY